MSLSLILSPSQSLAPAIIADSSRVYQTLIYYCLSLALSVDLPKRHPNFLISQALGLWTKWTSARTIFASRQSSPQAQNLQAHESPCSGCPECHYQLVSGSDMEPLCCRSHIQNVHFAVNCVENLSLKILSLVEVNAIIETRFFFTNIKAHHNRHGGWLSL